MGGCEEGLDVEGVGVGDRAVGKGGGVKVGVAEVHVL